MPCAKASMECNIIDLGMISCQQAYFFQRRVWEGIRHDNKLSSLIVCQHYPVITLGRVFKKEDILASKQDLRARNIEVVALDRGGSVTYHGPGQLVFYPIFDLNNFGRDIHLFLRNLEEVIISYLGRLGVSSQRISGMTGVWVAERKISSIGIAVRNWITYHGISVNICRQSLENSDLIKPCGMDICLDSVEGVLGRKIDLAQAKEGLMEKFKQVFNLIYTH